MKDDLFNCFVVTDQLDEFLCYEGRGKNNMVFLMKMMNR